jgi:hypothetical protein
MPSEVSRAVPDTTLSAGLERGIFPGMIGRDSTGGADVG